MSIETLQPPAQGTVHPNLTPPSPPVGHNSKWADHDKIVAFAGKFDSLADEETKLKARKKRLKQQAMNQGISLGMLDRVRKDLLLDPETVLEREAEYRHYHQAFDSPVGTQLSLFPVAVAKRELSQKEQMDKAFSRGKNLGLLGKDPDEQAYPPHTDLGQEHRRGWNEGQKTNHDFFIQLQEDDEAEEAKAAKKKQAKIDEQKKKTEERAAAKRDAAAKKLAEKERKAAEKKAAKEQKAEQKKAAKGDGDKVARPKFGRGKKH